MTLPAHLAIPGLSTAAGACVKTLLSVDGGGSRIIPGVPRPPESCAGAMYDSSTWWSSGTSHRRQVARHQRAGCGTIRELARRAFDAFLLAEVLGT
jgi:hypothetical protein